MSRCCTHYNINGPIRCELTTTVRETSSTVLETSFNDLAPNNLFEYKIHKCVFEVFKCKEYCTITLNLTN